MLKQKENVFIDKFQLLNSQENSEDIHWSSSDTTDTENASINDKVCSLTTKLQSRKRKRKKKLPKNISNLDVTILDTPKEPKGQTSPIITRKSDKTFLVTSPILKVLPKICVTNKPCRSKTKQPKSTDISNRSPILLQKHSSPNTSTKSRKKLFKTTNLETSPDGKKSPIFNGRTHTGSVEKLAGNVRTKEDFTDDTRSTSVQRTFTPIDSKSTSITDYVWIEGRHNEKNLVDDGNGTNHTRIIIKTEIVSVPDSSVAGVENTSILGNTSDEDLLIKNNNSQELARKVRAYFDSHFSSDSQTQHSITELQTPKDETKSDEIEMISSLTQMTKSNKNSFTSVSKIETPAESFETDCSTEKTKKLKYKKEGLAYRLSALLKKQNANISLWQHERFLAANSNFEIPKGEHSVFRIRNVNFKYGCYLLDAINFYDEEFFILITCQFNTCDLNDNVILKLYQPYTVVDYNDVKKLIINASKFECITL